MCYTANAMHRAAAIALTSIPTVTAAGVGFAVGGAERAVAFSGATAIISLLVAVYAGLGTAALHLRDWSADRIHNKKPVYVAFIEVVMAQTGTWGGVIAVSLLAAITVPGLVLSLFQSAVFGS